MTTETSGKWQKYAPYIIGGAIGVVGQATGTFTHIAELGLWRDLGADSVFALAVAFFYIGFGVLLLAALRFSALRGSVTTQNEAAEMADNPRPYVLQSISLVAWGLALAVLALAGPGAVIGATWGAVLCAVAMTIGLWTYRGSLRLLDELYRMATLEAAVMAYGLVLALSGGWAALAHLGLIAPPAMLTIVTMFWVLALASSVWASWRRGMLEE